MFSWLKRSKGKGHAIAFVDYEYWYYSYQKLYSISPDPEAWRAELEKRWRLEDIMVFGNFSSSMSGELPNLRRITNTIIETGNTFNHYKKDMTDFIMLDYIYQYAFDHPSIGTFIIFTGDGHFQTVVKYLKQKRRKNVVVYGVRDSFSSHLQAVATETAELPRKAETLDRATKALIENLTNVAKDPKIIPTFLGTIDTVSRKNSIPRGEVKKALLKMIREGYVLRTTRKVEPTRTVKIVQADAGRLKRDGMWLE